MAAAFADMNVRYPPVGAQNNAQNDDALFPKTAGFRWVSGRRGGYHRAGYIARIFHGGGIGGGGGRGRCGGLRIALGNDRRHAGRDLRRNDSLDTRRVDAGGERGGRQCDLRRRLFLLGAARRLRRWGRRGRRFDGQDVEMFNLGFRDDRLSRHQGGKCKSGNRNRGCECRKIGPPIRAIAAGCDGRDLRALGSVGGIVWAVALGRRGYGQGHGLTKACMTLAGGRSPKRVDIHTLVPLVMDQYSFITILSHGWNLPIWSMPYSANFDAVTGVVFGTDPVTAILCQYFKLSVAKAERPAAICAKCVP